MIKDSIAVIADLSESKPNVMYEVGYAHAMEKPTIHICSTPLKDLPFDVAHWNTIDYQQGQTHKLGRTIAQRLSSILA
jgi:nucleoside 2-deoxyribosyltransferase